MRADLQLGQALALELQRQGEARRHVELLQQPDLLLEGQVGGVAGGVGERAGLGDRAQERGDAAVVAAQLEDLLDDRAVLALEVAGAAVDGDVVGVLDDLDAQAADRRGLCAAPATPRAMPSSDGAAGAAGQADALGDAGDGADAGVLAVVARNEQDAILVPRVDGERHVHGREDDGVVKRDEQKVLRHVRPLRVQPLQTQL